jgi:hypothetical protein
MPSEYSGNPLFSKLSTFDQCPYKYKLHRDLQFQKAHSLEDLLSFNNQG